MKLLSTTAALILAAAPAFSQDKMTLLLDWFVNPDHGPIIVAQEKGYFAEQDLEVEVIAPADPSDPPKLVAAGRANWPSRISRSCTFKYMKACRLSVWAHWSRHR